MSLQEIVYEDIDWIHLAQDRGWWWASLSTAMKVRIPEEAERSASIAVAKML
jgi:hypothetical protein